MIEQLVYKYLDILGIAYEKQKKINYYTADIFVESKNLIIECDGNYWHSLKENIIRDKRKNTYLINHGYNLIRLSEFEIKEGSFKQKLIDMLQ